ncbi:MAG: hypothetical protein ACO1SX_06555, partial [Actinomycetota bacterium]
ERGEKLSPLAAVNNRADREPLTLECAQETMRVVADVAHTLLRLSETGPQPGTASLSGTLSGPAMRDFPYAPARILVEGTPHGTVAEAAPQLPGAATYGASFVLGNLPPGKYTVVVMRTGCKTFRKKVTLKRGGSQTLKIKLQADTPHGNLIRNPDLSVRWLRASGPDHWTAAGDEWVSAPFRVIPGEIYELGALNGKIKRTVGVRLSDNPHMPSDAERKELFGQNRVQPTTHFAQLIVKGGEEPTYAFAHPAPRKR